MSLPHAILGLLTISPMTGYELKTQAFDRSVAFFWHADQSQIYKTLTRMAADGWVDSTLEVQEDRPNRKVYAITPAGRAELLRWLHTEQPLPRQREAFLMQLFFASPLPNETILGFIEQQRAGHAANLAAYRSIDLPPLDDPTLDRDHTFWRLTLEFGVALEETYLRWLDQCAEVIRQLPEGDKTRHT